MCLITDDHKPIDLTGTKAYKVYRIKGGYLRNLFGWMDCKGSDRVESLLQMADRTFNDCILPRRIAYNRWEVGPGYIHAALYFHDTIMFYLDGTVWSDFLNAVVVRGRMVGLGYKSIDNSEVCAEGFLMEDIVYDPNIDGDLEVARRRIRELEACV